MATDITINKALLDDLRTKAQAATPGPWVASDSSVTIWCAATHDRLATCNPDDHWNDRTPEMAANGRYIAAVDPPTVLALLDEIKRLQSFVIRFLSAIVVNENNEGDEYTTYDLGKLDKLWLQLQETSKEVQ